MRFQAFATMHIKIWCFCAVVQCQLVKIHQCCGALVYYTSAPILHTDIFIPCILLPSLLVNTFSLQPSDWYIHISKQTDSSHTSTYIHSSTPLVPGILLEARWWDRQHVPKHQWIFNQLMVCNSPEAPGSNLQLHCYMHLKWRVFKILPLIYNIKMQIS